MNFPMLYWFVPRELVFLVKLALIGFLIFSAYLVVRWVRNSAPPGSRRKLRLGLFFGLVVLPIAVLLVGNQIMEERQIAARKQYFKDAWEHFHQSCESAHVTYFKTIPPQDGVFIMKPAKAPTTQQLKDQFWMGDPYDLPDAPESEARGLLYRKKSQPKGTPYAERGGFDFVEVPHPTIAGQYLRFTPKWESKANVDGYPIWDWKATEQKPETVSQRLARYGYTWDDISTPEDRKYWVAGGRLRVVELETGEIVAERVSFAIEPRFGVTSSLFNQEPWRGARICKHVHNGRREFISTALGTWNELEQTGEMK